MDDPATRYALDVTEGRIVAGPSARKACERHLRDLRAGAERGLAWAPERAALGYEFFACLRLADTGAFFDLHPAQQFIVGSILGWVGPDGYRRFRTAYIELAKGNGKTPLAAGMCLFFLLADGEMSSEIYTAAVSRDQAMICFRDVLRFVSESSALRARLDVGVANVADHASYGYIRPVSSEGRSLDGKRVSMAVLDELHEHPSPTVANKMRAGVKGRRQPLIFEITNSGYDRTSVCWQHHEHTQNVLDGIIEDDSWFGYVADLDPGDDWINDQSCWVKTNPLLGVSVTHKYLSSQVAEARSIASSYNTVARLNFCVWTEQATKFIDMDRWDECDAFTYSEDDLVGRECYAGLDLASTSDITAVVYVFPPLAGGERWKFVPRLFLPSDQVRKRAETARIPYDQWERQGYIVATEGNICDYAEIRKTIQRDAERFVIREIAFDPWNATQIVTELGGDGFTMVKFGQGYASMSAPTKELERIVNGQLAAFNRHPVLRWMAKNMSVKSDPAGNVKPDKDASAEKIDGIVAAIMGIARATASQSEAPPTEVHTA